MDSPILLNYNIFDIDIESIVIIESIGNIYPMMQSTMLLRVSCVVSVVVLTKFQGGEGANLLT